MTAAPAHSAVPRGPLLAAGALLLVTLIGVSAVRLGGQPVRAADAAPVASRLLRFEDRSDGGIAVIDAATGQLLEALQGEQGFLRGALRALARERRMQSLGPLPPFELTARADGRLTLTDTATRARVDLESFGHTNAGTFARLLLLPAPPRAP